MYAYSRIKKVSTKRSKSLDLTNLPAHTPTSFANYYNSNPKDNRPNPNITRSNTTTRLDPIRTPEQDPDEVGEVFGVILGRKYPGCSDSSTLSDEKQRSSFHSVLKRSFSMRRSASVTEGYRRMNRCRCHELSTAADEDDLYISSAKHNSQKNHAKKRGKLFKEYKNRIQEKWANALLQYSSASSSDQQPDLKLHANGLYENKNALSSHLVLDSNWRERRMMETKEEMRSVVKVQAEAFHVLE